LGKQPLPFMVTLDEFDRQNPTASSPADAKRRLRGITRALDELCEQKATSQVAGAGIYAQDPQMVRQISNTPALDFVVLVGGITVMRHSRDLLELFASLAERQIAVISAGVFRCGFLVGGSRFDSRLISDDDPAERHLFAWRKAFAAICHGHGVSPAHACIQFALSPPGVVAVLLNTSHPDRVAQNIDAAATNVPDGFWASMKEEGLLAEDYPFLG
jgi:D-threo-aldose 1-dehydrogenase